MDKGISFQFASADVEAKLTGTSFTPDEKTLFLSIQHPGEEMKDMNNHKVHSHAVNVKTPRPAVVPITGFKF